MSKLEVFFDYACPYCLKGHEILLSLIPELDDIEIIWHPCEAHPRPEKYGLHSDLCARGMYYISETGADIIKYHEIMYNAALKDRVDIENLEIISELVKDITDKNEFKKYLLSGKYSDKLDENNFSAWGKHKFSAVPSYKMNGKALVSVENIGVTSNMLKEFIVDAI